VSTLQITNIKYINEVIRSGKYDRHYKDGQKRQGMVNKVLHRKLVIKHHEPN
jgi:hypothetical protein